MSDLSKRTVKLHESLIRLSKGMIKAWEEWLKSHTNETK